MRTMRKPTSKIGLDAILPPNAAFLHPAPGKFKYVVKSETKSVFLTKAN
jgi:hypothetical protein